MKNALKAIGLLAALTFLIAPDPARADAPPAAAPAPAPAAAPTPAPEAKPEPAATDPAALAAKLDSLYAHRGSKAAENDAAVTEALKAAPKDYGILWRAARWHWWVGDGQSGTRRETEGKRAWDLGARAAQLQPDKVEGNYFAGAGAGMYSQGIGVLKALTKGMEGIFNGFIDKAIKLDPGYFMGGPLIAKARYFYELPWPKRDLGKSAELYKKALKLHPDNIRAKLWLAETLVKDGEGKEAKTYLDQVDAQIKNPGSFDPAEIKRVGTMVPEVQKKVEEELK